MFLGLSNIRQEERQSLPVWPSVVRNRIDRIGLRSTEDTDDVSNVCSSDDSDDRPGHSSVRQDEPPAVMSDVLALQIADAFVA